MVAPRRAVVAALAASAASTSAARDGIEEGARHRSFRDTNSGRRLRLVDEKPRRRRDDGGDDEGGGFRRVLQTAGRPPRNDACESAAFISALPFRASGTTVDSAPDFTSDPCGAPAYASGVWYAYTHSSSPRMITASVDGTFTPSVRVYTGTGCEEEELACLSPPKVTYTFLGETDVRYRFLVANYAQGSNAGAAFTIEIRDYKVPENDECESATVIASLPYAGNGTTTGSLPDFDPDIQDFDSCTFGQWYGAKGANGVWYSYAPPTAGFLTATVAGSGSQGIRIFSGGGCSYEELACVERNRATHTFLCEGGVTYRFLISIGRFDVGSEFDFELRDYDVPANDECDAAVVIPSLPYQGDGTTLGALPDFDGLSCNAYASANGVWYVYEPSESRILTASVDSGQSLRVYSGETCDDADLTCVGQITSSNTFVGYAAVQYRFLVSKGSFDIGSAFEIDVKDYEVPANDECNDAIVIPSLPYQEGGTTLGALPDFDGISCNAYASANGVWYSYTPTESKILTASVDSGQSLRVYSGETCDDADLTCAGQITSSNTFVGYASVQYRFLVSKGSFDLGSAFEIDVRDYDVPANDECVSAIVIPSLPYQETGTTLGALPDFDGLSCNAYASANGVWYSYTPPETRVLTAAIDPGQPMGQRQRLRVYSGEGCDDAQLTCVEPLTADRTFLGEAGVTYRILVSVGSFDLGSTFEIDVKEYDVPVNDECDAAIVILSLPYRAVGTTIGALPDFDGFSCNAYASANGVWYTYTSTASQTLKVAVDSGQRIRVYSGDECEDADLACLGIIAEESTFDAEAGVTYRFLISKGSFDLGSEFSFSVEAETSTVPPTTGNGVPPNDECVGAIAIPSLPHQEDGTTVGATADFDSDSCNARASANGVWYTYTPSESKIITATVDNGQGVRVYYGDDCDTFWLTCLNPIPTGGFVPRTENTFIGRAGLEYKLLISKGSFDTGSEFTIKVVDYDVPENDDCNAATLIPSLPYQENGTTLGALPDFDGDSCNARASANGVWYTYTPSESKVITATVDNGQGFRVYSGEGCDESELTCVDPIPTGGFVPRSEHTFVLEEGVQYRFLVSKGVFNLGSEFSINMVDYPVPANDECSAARVISSLPHQEDGTTLGALPDFDGNSCNAYASANGVWYTYTPSESEITTVTVNDDQGLRVYSGEGCDDSQLTCLSYSGSGWLGGIGSEHTFVGVADVRYSFLISKGSFDLGSELSIEVIDYEVPANSQCDAAILIPALPFQKNGTTLGALPDFDVDSCNAYASANGVWYTYSPAEKKTLTAVVDSGHGLRVYSGEGCDNSQLTCISYSGSGWLGGIGSEHTFDADAGVRYSFLISKGSFDLGSEFSFRVVDETGTASPIVSTLPPSMPPSVAPATLPPSNWPSLSLQPTGSSFPSDSPSVSGNPTGSSFPTDSEKPSSLLSSQLPSDLPSSRPSGSLAPSSSELPSYKPSASTEPSSTIKPSYEPSYAPSKDIGALPTTKSPTESPSKDPTGAPIPDKIETPAPTPEPTPKEEEDTKSPTKCECVCPTTKPTRESTTTTSTKTSKSTKSSKSQKKKNKKKKKNRKPRNRKERGRKKQHVVHVGELNEGAGGVNKASLTEANPDFRGYQNVFGDDPTLFPTLSPTLSPTLLPVETAGSPGAGTGGADIHVQAAHSNLRAHSDQSDEDQEGLFP